MHIYTYYKVTNIYNKLKFLCFYYSLRLPLEGRESQ